MVYYTPFLAVLVLFAVPSTGVYQDYFELDDLRPRRQTPGRPAPAGIVRYECTRDLLIVWDNSNSVGKLPFTKYVKPFITQIIDSEKLGVGPEGTQMGIISFSDSDHTKVYLPFGSKTSKSALKTFVNRLNYDDLKGGYTLTGRALEIANEIFSKKNPDNNRPEIPDVVILITDGNPRNGKWRPRGQPDSEIPMAITQADRLKENDIRIVTVAVGQDKNMEVMKSLSTGKPFDVKTFEDLSGIVDSLVDESCKPLPGVCQCPITQSETIYVNIGQKKQVWWEEPKLQCENAPEVVSTVVEPKGARPGNQFWVGEHDITYTIKYEAGRKIKSMQCVVKLTVENYPCMGEKYNSKEKECCCGVLHDIKPGWRCCGSAYYNQRLQKCCDEKHANVKNKDRKC